MHSHSQILVVSRDRTLLQTRQLILGTYFDVRTAGRMSEAGSILSKSDFDLIVLCDTLTEPERQQVAEMVRDQRPKPTLLSLLGPGTKDHPPCIGRRLECMGGPLQLLRECADVLGFDLRSSSKQRMFTN